MKSNNIKVKTSQRHTSHAQFWKSQPAIDGKKWTFHAINQHYNMTQLDMDESTRWQHVKFDDIVENDDDWKLEKRESDNDENEDEEESDD